MKNRPMRNESKFAKKPAPKLVPSSSITLTFKSPEQAAWIRELVALINEPAHEEDEPLRLCQMAADLFIDPVPDPETIKYEVPLRPDYETTWGFIALLRNQLVRKANFLDGQLIVLGEYLQSLGAENAKTAETMPDLPSEVPHG